jgi:hypothetical protein
MKLILFILLFFFACQKDDTQRWICYNIHYTKPCTKCGDQLVRFTLDSFNIDTDETTIAIFMSQNNYVDSIGNGYSWECKLR